MAENSPDEHREETGVLLGFLEEAEYWQLQSPQFPSKVGGRPAWLSQSDLPSPSELACEKCQLPTAFLLQVYAPIVGQDRSFHRTIFLFCCKTPACYSHNDSRCFKVYRSQLPRRNDFYPYDPPEEEEPTGGASETFVLGSGVKLCRVCGCPGTKTCSRCHSANYCSRHHQTADWKAGHKERCSSGALSGEPNPVHGFLFPEFELVTEPEEVPVRDAEELSKPLEESQQSPPYSHLPGEGLESPDLKDLETMAMHETEDQKLFQKFKQRTAHEPHQVLRYCRKGSPLWVSAEHRPQEKDIPNCSCGARRVFEFQVMPQLLNHLKVDTLQESIDWGVLAVYTCTETCEQGNSYTAEFIWKQDFAADPRNTED
ncbi:programmed cell death protein 2 isoform X1 [Lepisosteus oculatus]|uniref:programmed cell death protein 2 isoform X1 n=1 Tax=Lepisosteus oculatus TaxID=7918 RepID=UPI0035F5102E